METIEKNPFRPSFGSIPVALAGRQAIIKDILEGLDNAPGDPNRASIFTGARGTGKTVLLAAIGEEAQKRGWINVNVTSGMDMLSEIIVQIRDRAFHILTPQTQKRLSGIQIGSFGITIENEKKQSTWRSEMTGIVEELNSNSVGLLITVDEISPKHAELKILTDTFQHFVRERRDVALLMAGLPAKVSRLLRDDDISFLRRAFCHELTAIDVNDVAYAIKQTVEEGGREIDDKALWKAARGTEGFAFMIQLIGYHMWRQHPKERKIYEEDVDTALTFAAHDMERMIFDLLLRELSEREKEFLMAMIQDGNSSKVADISRRMGINVNNASQIKKRLIEQGIISDYGRGTVKMEVPMLKEYLKNR